MSTGNGNRTGYGDPPTRRQLEVLAMIISMKAEHGFYPTLRELADAMNCSHGTIQHHLTSMERKNVIKQKNGQPRAFIIPGTQQCHRCGGHGFEPATVDLTEELCR